MLIRDHFQNFKSYQLPKAQLIIADVPYNLGNNAYAFKSGIGIKMAITKMEKAI